MVPACPQFHPPPFGSAPLSSHLILPSPSSCFLQTKLRLDAFLAAKLPAASRARLQASIKEGLVVVNGRQQVGCHFAPPLHREVCCHWPLA